MKQLDCPDPVDTFDKWVAVPAELLGVTRQHVRSLSGHITELERIVPIEHDHRMPDGGCSTCDILGLLRVYEQDQPVEVGSVRRELFDSVVSSCRTFHRLWLVASILNVGLAVVLFLRVIAP